MIFMMHALFGLLNHMLTYQRAMQLGARAALLAQANVEMTDHVFEYFSADWEIAVFVHAICAFCPLSLPLHALRNFRCDFGSR